MQRKRVFRALEHFGAPLLELTPKDLTAPDTVFQIGLAPRRIDILTSIDGVAFDDAWQARQEQTLEGVCVAVIDSKHLLQNKRATGRPKDLADVAWLESAGLDT